jgi:hypothetical protein
MDNLPAAGGGWAIKEGSPLWKDLVKLRGEARKGRIQLLTHEQVFGKRPISRREPECEYCFCDGLPDQAVIFLAVCPHDKAYALK